MRSATPKVLHPLCGRPMLLHVLDALEALPLERIVVVVGHAAEHVTKTLQEQVTGTVPVEFVEQHKQRGTGDAVSVALTAFADDLDVEDDLIIVMGDAPLLRAETLAMLATEHRHADAAASLLTARVPDPTGLRPHRARRPGPGRPHRRAGRRRPRRARDRRGQPVDLLLPARLPRTRAPAAEPGERAGRVLPHRRRRGAAPGRPRRARRRGRRPDRGGGRQRPRPARRGGGRAALAHQPRLDALGGRR